jgi:LEA14-like dessication related protein
MIKCPKVILIILCTILAFSSCRNFEDLKLGDIQEVQVLGFEDNYLKLNVLIPIENPTIHKLSIKNIDGRVFINQQYIGKIVVDENIIIKPVSKKVYTTQVKIRIANIMNMAFIMMNLSKGKLVEFSIEGNIEVKTMLITRNFEINESRSVKM